ncbi:MAG: hypothetical protein ACFE0J_14340 [Elainellaceae cyanobacterium]
MCFTNPDPQLFENAEDLNLVPVANPPEPERERLRHDHRLTRRRALVKPLPLGVSVINRLHVLQYAEQSTWSRLIKIPEGGVVITPDQGAVLSYLLRYRQLG